MSFEEQIMSKDKYAGLFSHQVRAIVFIILEISLQYAGKMFTNSLLFTAYDVHLCSLVRLYEPTKCSLILFYLKLEVTRILFVLDVRFEN